MSFSLKTLLRSSEKTKNFPLKFHCKTEINYKDKVFQCILCIFSDRVAFVHNLKIKKLILFSDAKITKLENGLKFKLKKEDIEIYFKNEKLLENLLSYFPINKKEPVCDENNIFISVEFSNLNFMTMCRKEDGLSGMKISILERLAIFFFKNKKLNESIDLKIFEPLIFLLKHKRKYVHLKTDSDFFASAQFLKNRLEIKLKK